MRSSVAVVRPLALLLVLAQLLLLQAALPGTGGLTITTAVALAATATAAAVLAAGILLTGRCAPVVRPARVRTAIRDRDRRTAFLPQRDPDAPGRRRPRAPGHAGPATAA
ncbi:hypothetical protein JK359_00370 [Streptomyces actinomycinicus]|uniref:Uncharacterized protein n=1 Tax=Streptomyces actinomycinicus TaxID=1695166 RepID=A0A937EE39_9ACTN|nr:DUF6412 domain-containing protein [Streptomyces actinomycinicus]MBL1080444.1 hypothetical protein [Streptomyces actinomycinicus]